MAGERPPLKICYEDEEIHGTAITVGHIDLYRDGFLGKGAFGTVYRGRSAGRDVAVKRIEYHTKEEEEKIGNEIKSLLKLDANNAKVITYYTAVKSPEFYYIAMELGVCTVHDYVTQNGKFTGLRISSIDEVRILRESSEGLEWLHKRQIMHRDIKPEHILLVRDKKDGIVAKLADFGISKELTSGTQAMTSWKGTLDWMAPEVQESGGQIGSVGAADVFSLGLVFYYVLSKGGHPFSKNGTRSAKVRKTEIARLDVVPKGSMRSLIEEMIQITPGDRPSSKYVARHPTFWEPQKTQLFYQAISDHIMAKDEELKATVDKCPTRVFEEQGEQGEPRDWRTIIDKSLDAGSFKSYREASVSQLLRLIRNKLHHFNGIPEEGRLLVGDKPSGLVDYIADKFPLLLMHVWEAAEIRRYKPDIQHFYTGFSTTKLDSNTIILPAGVGLIELTELRSSQKTVKRLSVNFADLPLLRGQLPEGLECLNVIGPEVTEPRWPEWYEDGLSVSLQGVAADTISHLADLGRTVTRLEIYDCPDLTAGSLEPLTRYPDLGRLTLSGGVPDTVSLEPLTKCRGLEYLSISTADLPLLRGQLPEGLRCLNVRGPEVTKPRWPGRYWSLSVSLQGVTADTISHLTDLGRTVGGLYIYDCPELTAGSLEPINRHPWLMYLSVSAADFPRLRGQLPGSLQRLNVRGLEVTEPRWPGESRWDGLSVSLQGVAADFISDLADLEPKVTQLEIYDCPDFMAGSLEPLTKCPQLFSLTLSGGVPDTVSLEPLTKCRGLEYLSISTADLPLLRGQLPEGLRFLNVRGPEVTEPRWPERHGSGLSVSFQGVTADTISHLATELGSRITLLDTDAQMTTIPSQLRGAIIRVDPNTVIFPAGVGYSELTKLRSSGETVERLSVTAADLPRLREQLPEGLERLNVRGPEVTEPRWPEWDEDNGLSVSLQGVAADTISHLADLGRTVALLEIYDCLDLTAGSLQPLTRCRGLGRLTLSGGVPDTVSLEPLTRCTELHWLTLSGGVPDTVLFSLSGWPGLWSLTLGDRQRPAETAFTAAAVTRLVKSCRELAYLYLHCTADTGRAVLTALKEADLRYSDDWPRVIRLRVPVKLYCQLKSQEGDGVDVWEWND